MNPLPHRKDQGRAPLARSYWLGAAFFTVVALILATAVVPLVRADHVFHATPGQAAITIWVMIGCNLMLAARLVWAALRADRPGPTATRLLGWWAGLSLLLALLLLDPAFGYFEHNDPAMKRAALLLFLCVAIEALGATLAFVALIRERRTHS